jgi:hypothetical protein
MTKQMERTIRQIVKGNRLISFINNEEGVDPFTNEKRVVYDGGSTPKRYVKDLKELIEVARIEGTATGSIDGIIKILVYTSFIDEAAGLDNATALGPLHYASSSADSRVIVSDFMSQLSVPVCEPIFLVGLDKETIFDLLFCRLRVVVSFNVDALVEYFNEGGIKTRWLSKKETFEYLKVKQDKNRIFTFGKQGIRINMPQQELTLGSAFVIKLLYECVRPSELRAMYVKMRDDIENWSE